MLCQDWLRHAGTPGIHAYHIAVQSQQCAVQSCKHSFEQLSHEFARHSTCIGSMWITNHTTSQETFGFLSSPGPKREKKVDAWGEDRQLLFFFFHSVSACLFLRRGQAATFLLSTLVIFFWFETQHSSTFQGVKDFYSLQWDDIDIKMTLTAGPMGNVSIYLIGVYGRTSGKTKSWSNTCVA